MLRAAIVFFVLSIVSAFFGFGGLAADAAWIAKAAFVVFLVLAAMSFFMGRRATT